MHDLPLGEWQWDKPIFRYYDEDSLLILQEKEKKRKFIRAFIKSPDRYTGFGIETDIDLPIHAVLSLTWRSRGASPLIQVDILDASAAIHENAPAGEVYCFFTPQPADEWQTDKIAVSRFKRDPHQSPDRPNDGRFDLDGVRSVQFTFMPGSVIQLDILELFFEWGAAKFPFLVLLAVLLASAFLFLLRSISLSRLLLDDGLGFARYSANRLVLSLLAIAAGINALAVTGTRINQIVFYFYAVLLLLVFADEFRLRLFADSRWWSLRYLVVMACFWLAGMSLPMLSLVFLYPIVFISVISRRDRLLLIMTALISILVLFGRSPLESGLVFFNAVIFILMITIISAFMLHVSTLKKARRETEQAIALYEGIFKNASDAIYTCDNSGRITNVNKGFEKMVGKTREQVIGREISAFIHSEDLSVLAQNKDFSIASAQYEIRFLGPGGRHFRNCLVSQQVINFEGINKGFQCIATDITARKKMEEALKQANLKLNRLAASDSLTKIANRRKFDETYQLEWLRARRKGSSLAVILCDIDHFKQYNDRYGHQQGDACLKKIASALDKAVQRPGDLVARYGGEEFIVLLAETDLKNGRLICEKLFALINDLGIKHSGSPLGRVTASFGLAAVFPDRQMPPEYLIRRADEALYRAKSGGRNRIEESCGNEIQ